MNIHGIVRSLTPDRQIPFSLYVIFLQERSLFSKSKQIYRYPVSENAKEVALALLQDHLHLLFSVITQGEPAVNSLFYTLREYRNLNSNSGSILVPRLYYHKMLNGAVNTFLRASWSGILVFGFMLPVFCYRFS